MSHSNNTLSPEQSELGKKAQYDANYNPDKLFPIPRKAKRDEIGLANDLPFYGLDLWNHYEVSWLNPKGKPMVAIAEIIYPCESPNIIESKSMKLYFNSFNNTKCESVASVKEVMQRDMSERIGAEVTVNIYLLSELKEVDFAVRLNGTYIDDLDVECDTYQTTPEFLCVEDEVAEETLCTDLLKSNCLVTHQPDWCSVEVTYKGKKINREGLLKYIVSFRNHNEFHEQCIEKIFVHIMERCQPEELTINGRSTRRGGLDINSFRSTKPLTGSVTNTRLCRQ